MKMSIVFLILFLPLESVFAKSLFARLTTRLGFTCPFHFNNSYIRLEQDLQAIRNSSQEPFLKKQGFSPSYYSGVDKAREFKRVQQYLQEINADPKTTHVSYFANQAEQTIFEFEEGLKKQNQENTSFLEERLKILEEFKKEAQKRIKDQKVTYDWWANFNLRLVILATPDAYLTQYFKHITPSFKTHEDIEKHSNHPDLKIFQDIKEMFPETIMFFSTGDFGIMAFNRMGASFHFIGVSGSNKSADDQAMLPLRFFIHDVGHARESIYSAKRIDNLKITIEVKDIEKKLNNISNKSDRQKAEFAWFLFNHELGKTKYIHHLSSTNIFSKKKKQILHDSMRNYLNLEFSIINEDNGVLIRDLFKDFVPDHLKRARKDKDEKSVKLFLDKTLDIFMKVFSDILISAR